jgi:hypothetical protein
MYSASATLGVGLMASHDLGGARRVGHDQVERAEQRVVVVVIDVQQVGAVAQHARGVAVDVAAVQEYDRPLGDVLRRRLDEPVQREEAILARQRQVVGGDEHHRVLAQDAEHALHRHQRAQRVAVRVFVGGEHEALVLAQPLEHELARGQALERGAGLRVGRLAHTVCSPSPSSSPSGDDAGDDAISSSTRIARSVVSS